MRALVALALALAACGQAAPPESKHADLDLSGGSLLVKATALTAADGAKVFATEYHVDKPKALILLFHQAGSGKGEYAAIGPRLARAGYASLAIDQRSGGDLYGSNETVKALGKNADFLAAEQDVQAAVDWAKKQKLPIIVWGSSYSSSLVFPLAAKNPEVKAVLAFSPGEYFDEKTLVRTAAAKVAVPVFVTSASSASEVAEAAKIAHAVPGGRATQFIPKVGVHGSSTLNADKDPQGAETNWSAVMAFLRRVAP